MIYLIHFLIPENFFNKKIKNFKIKNKVNLFLININLLKNN